MAANAFCPGLSGTPDAFARERAPTRSGRIAGVATAAIPLRRIHRGHGRSHEQAAFACNAIALAPGRAWMSAGAAAALAPATRGVLRAAGLELGSVPLGAIEAAGGSLRCCVAEIF